MLLVTTFHLFHTCRAPGEPSRVDGPLGRPSREELYLHLLLLPSAVTPSTGSTATLGGPSWLTSPPFLKPRCPPASLPGPSSCPLLLLSKSKVRGSRPAPLSLTSTEVLRRTLSLPLDLSSLGPAAHSHTAHGVAVVRKKLQPRILTRTEHIAVASPHVIWSQ